MKRPWMPLYVADYIADTRHLTGAEHGAYLHLMMHYWANGGLPVEDFRLQAIACMDAEQWQRSRPTIASFFDENWKHKRIDEELEKALSISKSRKRAGKLGRKQRSKNQANAIAKQEHLPTHSHSHSHKENIIKESKKEAGEEEGFEDFWKSYPPRSPSSPKDLARKSWVRALNGYIDRQSKIKYPPADPDAIVRGARGFFDATTGQHKTEFIPMASTWLNQRRWDAHADTKPSLSAEEQERLLAKYREKQGAAA